jgi:hypothetical protein
VQFQYKISRRDRARHCLNSLIRTELRKIIILRSIISANSWLEFHRNDDWQQPLWSASISYKMICYGYFETVLNITKMWCSSSVKCYTLARNIQLVYVSFSYPEPHQSEEGQFSCFSSNWTRDLIFFVLKWDVLEILGFASIALTSGTNDAWQNLFPV